MMKQFIQILFIHHHSDSVNSVMIEGEWKILNKKSLLYDHQELNQRSKEELKKLLRRAQN